MGLRNYIYRLKRKFITVIQKEIPVKIPEFCGSLLENKTVLITGGGSGIGYAIAEACIRNGAKVVITGRNRDKLEHAIKVWRQEFNADVDYVVMDICETETLKSAFEAVLEKTNQKGIDILVNNAGVSEGAMFGQTEEELFDLTMETNVKGTYFLSQIFANYLISNKKGGNILNICSVSGVRPAVTPYMCSKWSEIGLTKGMGKKLIPYGIVVNGLAPGPTASGMLEKKADGNLRLETSPAGRYVTPEEVANMAVILISDMGKMIVGETLFITGGCGTLTLDDIQY